jgi:dienelactone hydrolase
MFFAKPRTLARLAAISAVSLASTADAQYVRQEVIAVQSEHASVTEFLTGAKGQPVTLAGHLRLAKPGPKQPVVLLMHGAGGVGASNAVVGEWSRVLNEAGFSTFTLDSYAGRGITNLADAQKLSAISRVRDAFAARELLAKHPLVDPDKIVVMGFSHGGSAAINSNLERFQKMYGSAKFTAHIPVYAPCAARMQQDEKAASPIMFIHGTADDWVPAAPCREYAARLKAAGNDARFNEYADAHHAFDGPVLGAVKKLENVSTNASCRQEERENGLVVNVETGKPVGPDDSCRTKGVSLGYNAEATKKAHADVIAFLKEVLK